MSVSGVSQCIIGAMIQQGGATVRIAEVNKSIKFQVNGGLYASIVREDFQLAFPQTQLW